MLSICKYMRSYNHDGKWLFTITGTCDTCNITELSPAYLYPHSPEHDMIEPVTANKPVRDLPLNFTLKQGSHQSPEDGMCLMEATAYVAGLPHSDAPSCTSPVLTSIAFRLNDSWDDQERQLLAPLIPLLIGTRSTHDHDRLRAYAMVDAAIRELAPMVLDAAGWHDLANRMRELAPVVDVVSASAAEAACGEIWEDGRQRAAAGPAAAYAAADAADAAAYAAYASAYAAAAAAASSACTAADAAAYAAVAAADSSARLQSAARRPIIEATVRAFERVIAVGGLAATNTPSLDGENGSR